jgi:hypothetical protein
MLKTLLTSVLLAFCLADVARAQDQISARLTLSVTGVPSSMGYATTPNPFKHVWSKPAGAARRFTALSHDDGRTSGMCSGRRWKCIVVGALVGGGLGVFIGNAYGDGPKYATGNSLIGPVRECIANCDGHVNNKREFGISGLIVGGGLVSLFTRNDQ